MPETAVPPTTSAAIPSTAATTAPEFLVEGFGSGLVSLGGRRFRVAVADVWDLQTQGLKGVGELPSDAGMLFVFPQLVNYPFTMSEVLLPLDLGLFDESRRLIEVISMTSCRDLPCEGYQPSAPYRYALELNPGGFVDVAEGTVLEIVP